jgi:hypothetical protein
VSEAVSGLTIQNNTISGSFQFAIAQSNMPQNLRIIGNSVQLTNAGGIGLVFFGSPSGTTTSATVDANVFSTGNNNAAIFISVDTGTLLLDIEGNELRGETGVNIMAGSNSIAGIDLGGGSQGSLGGNNFRFFTSPATTTSGAIASNATTGTIQAQTNIFAVADPQTVIHAGGATVNATALSANAAFVDALYEDFLKRPANTASAADAGGWINQLNGGASPPSLASATARSPEALGILVDGLYVKLLARAADAGGRQNFISFLQGGGTLEQVTALMTTSPEFANLAGSDGGFVQALYLHLLGRIGSNAEVSGWVNKIPSIGRAGVVGAILNSGEFRGDAVQALYGFLQQPAVSITSLLPDLLDRTAAPGAGEINPWVMSSLDIDTIMVDLAATTEYFTKR